MMFGGNRANEEVSGPNPAFEMRTETENGWKPSYLRRRVLAAFVIFFCAVIVVLEVLSQVSSAHAGLATSVENFHYSWTYGPTAILTIVAALWARVEFQAKEGAPWQEMLNNPQAKAGHSVLLDYVSMLQPISLIKSLRNRHYTVAASTGCSLTLRLLIILSTGLFSLQPTPIDTGQVPVHLSTTFDTFNASVKLEAASSKAYDVLNAIIYKNSTYAEGTNANFAYQTASSAGLPSNALINSTADSVGANLECERAAFNSANFSTQGQGLLTTPSCSMLMYFNNILHDNLRVVAEVVQPQQCSNSHNKNDQRVSIFMGNLFPSKNVPNNGRFPPFTNLSISHSVQYLCKPVYSVQKLAIRLNTTDSYSMKLQGNLTAGEHLPGLTALDVANQAFSYAQDYLKAPEPVNDDKLFTGKNMSIDLSLTLGARLSGFEGSEQDLYSDDNIMHIFTTYYRAITAQLIGQTLLQPKESEVLGRAIVSQNRVIVTDLSLRAMEVCLGMILLSILAMNLPKLRYTMLPWNPSTIKAVASVLSKNSEIRETFQGTGSASEETLFHLLKEQKYTLRRDEKAVNIEMKSDQNPELEGDRESTFGKWRPFPGLIVRVLFFTVIAGVIASLESVLHVSQTRNGLGDVSNGLYTHYLWTLLPALAMIAISLCFGSIDFNTRSLAPYASLKKMDGVCFRYLTTSDFMDSLSGMNIVKSIKLKEYAVLATTTAAILGSFLTIVSSGLYSAIDTSVVREINFTQTTVPIDSRVLSTEVSDGTENGVSGMQTANEILNANLTFPQWTWKEFAFPNITFDKSLLSQNTSGMSVDIVVPALRSSLDCQLRNSTELFANFTPVRTASTSPYAGPTVMINSTILPCSDHENTTSKRTQIRGAGNTAVEGKYLPVGYFGTSSGSSCYLNGTSLDAAFKPNPAVNFNQNQVSYTWGQTTADSLVNLMELACMDSPEVVQTKVRLLLPDLTVDEDHPPVAIEKTATKSVHAFLPLTYNWYYLQSYDQSATGLDPFFQALVSGKYAIPQEYLSDTKKIQAVAEAIKFQHKIIKAQQISHNAQRPANGTLDNVPLIGNVTNPSHLRLFQDPTSTRILEVILAVMLFLGILSSVLMNTDDVLPKNPNSIAALASLLADSNFLEFFQHVPDPTDEKIGDTVFSRSRFYLGWLDNQNFPDPGFVNKGSFWSSNKASVSGDLKFTIYVDDYEGKPI